MHRLTKLAKKQMMKERSFAIYKNYRDAGDSVEASTVGS
jgi:hypothetical protein